MLKLSWLRLEGGKTEEPLVNYLTSDCGQLIWTFLLGSDTAGSPITVTADELPGAVVTQSQSTYKGNGILKTALSSGSPTNTVVVTSQGNQFFTFSDASVFTVGKTQISVGLGASVEAQTIEGNHACGGLINVGGKSDLGDSNPKGTLEAEHVIFYGGKAHNGGALHIAKGALATLRYCTFESNDAKNQGGAIYVSEWRNQEDSNFIGLKLFSTKFLNNYAMEDGSFVLFFIYFSPAKKKVGSHLKTPLIILFFLLLCSFAHRWRNFCGDSQQNMVC